MVGMKLGLYMFFLVKLEPDFGEDQDGLSNDEIEATRKDLKKRRPKS